ncbi:MAG: hypothetical protein AB7N65_18145 [Vicinamibacterales bacterium]
MSESNELTDLSLALLASVKSDKTDCLDNGTFLETVFAAIPPATSPALVSFRGNPASNSEAAWKAVPWAAAPNARTPSPSDANNYFSLAAYRRKDSAPFRRRKSDFDALYAVMLDDVGTKIPLDRVTLSPSWLLETSPANYQVGYLLTAPLADAERADCLMEAIISAGLCDPGAGGPTTRLARLPTGVNGKTDPPFTCRLVEWAPHHRYSVDELVSGLALEFLSTDQSNKRRNAKRARLRKAHQETPDTARQGDTALDALRARGLYKSDLGGGKHDITCPWVSDHTDQVDGGTAYFEPDDRRPLGGFHCFHGHCADRTIHDLIEYLDIARNPDRSKPTVRVVPGEIHVAVDAAEQLLAESGRFYQRNGMIVTVVTDPVFSVPQVRNLSSQALVRELSELAHWERFDARSNDWVRVDPPARVISVLADSATYKHLPALKDIVHQPYFSTDGSLVTASGYIPATGMYGVFGACEFDVPARPTRADAEAALAMLRELLEEFSFARSEDEAAAVSAMLTAAVRASLPSAPLFLITAHMIGSGKSYLSALISAFATPQGAVPLSFPQEEAEMRKLLLAALLQSPRVIDFDNLTRDLMPHPSLCTALTSESVSGRILGQSKTTIVGTRTLFLASGNNVMPTEDMTRRCVTIRLSPACEHPASQSFERPELVHEVLRDRGRYVSAALTLLRSWMVAGRPMRPCRGVAGFREWSDWCRQPLLWLGMPDPAASLFEALSSDTDRELLGRLLTVWRDEFGSAPTRVRAVVQRADEAPDEDGLAGVLRDVAGEGETLNKQRLGLWIKRHAGQIVHGLRFVPVEGKRSAAMWRVETVLSDLSDPTAESRKTVTDGSQVDGKAVKARARTAGRSRAEKRASQ